MDSLLTQFFASASSLPVALIHLSLFGVTIVAAAQGVANFPIGLASLAVQVPYSTSLRLPPPHLHTLEIFHWFLHSSGDEVWITVVKYSH